MANFNRILKPKANIGKNGFDLSQNHVFTSKIGLMNVPFVVDTIPDGTYDIDVANIVRTQPLNKPAFMRLKGYLHFYFVPYRQLWHQWDNFYTSRNDSVSSYIQSNVYVPSFNIQTLVNACIDNVLDPTVVTTSASRDMLGYASHAGIIRMLDMLGYGNYESYYEARDTQSVTLQTPNYYPNLFRVLAYNKIWNDYHRNPFYQQPTPQMFNADFLPCSSLANSSVTDYTTSQQALSTAFNMFKPKYVQWKHDLFMGSLPDQQFGGVSTVNSNDVLLHNITDSTSIPSGARTGLNPSNNLSLLNSEGATAYNTEKWNINDLFSVLELRKAEALQVWKEKTLRAGNKAYDQYKAHFGVEVNALKNDHADYIGGYSFNVGVDEVTNQTAGLQDSTLGELAGKGYGVGNSHIRYHAQEFGVLMAILYFIPENQYSSSMIDPACTYKDRFDFYTPEFMNIGLQPIPRYYLSIINQQDDPNQIIGYSARYFGYKTGIDKVHGLFDPSVQNELSAWVAPRKDLQSRSFQYLTSEALYVNPNVMDTIFGVSANSFQNSDQLICNFNFDVKAVLPMSVVGLEIF